MHNLQTNGDGGNGDLRGVHRSKEIVSLTIFPIRTAATASTKTTTMIASGAVRWKYCARVAQEAEIHKTLFIISLFLCFTAFGRIQSPDDVVV